MRYTVRPISDRTPFPGEYVSSPFKASWSDTLDILDRELYQLDAEDVVLEIDCDERAIRLDGMLRSDAKVASPAVRIAFESRHGSLTYATDRFISPSYRRTLTDWQHNVRAIALALEGLRRVDRYGVTKRGEQYAGWKAIEATPVGMSRNQALQTLCGFAGLDGQPGALDNLPRLLKLARRRTHPDTVGSRSAWDQVEQAARVLGLETT